ncbi:SDR family NAD(P)-dependent oxidoreductase [Streptomyces olivoreticuli]|uniref:type I polyketide synthase n=1 Tax=Streptomyces olivoreticuli TaxID=68246 RepID=UPI0026594259|nr:type I polyketide synthase [Streptomyces olivoreticuli]WKK23941.1 SDR family NAD(P)-dependent oxidoreductase [Streptomyces olivoreticuli]
MPRTFPSSSVPSADAIAVVGVACRLPAGIDTLDALWPVLLAGRDVTVPVPPDRFDASRWLDPDPRRPGKTYVAKGGFLAGIQEFDAEYFGMSPREAARLDPLQRMLLEMAVEAIDDAGYPPLSLAGSGTAVYTGVSSHGFASLQELDPVTVDAYTMPGGAAANTANRISYALDLHGPSLAVDTACSSALVALHHACEALRHGRCEAALAGGANLLLGPIEFVGFAKASMLSPTGRCRPFSAEADGYVRSEGGGLVLLKPLAHALEDGDRVQAVILGSGVNTNGHTPGLTQPSAEAQEALLREVYTAAGVRPDEVAYVEMHGTGTPVGDPAECRAVGRALGEGRPAGSPLQVGSVKGLLGHLEPASGMAGLCKALLMLRHRRVPASPYARPLNPAIDFEGLRLAPALETGPLRPGSEERAVIGVNSFGFGGANAHVVLASPPAQLPGPSPDATARLPVLVSARTPAAAAEAARRLAGRLRQCPPGEFYDLAHTSFLRRGRHEHRAVVLAARPQEAAAEFDALARGEQDVAGAFTEGADGAAVALMFSGNGAQWAGMGCDLLAAEPAFRAGVAEADETLRPLLGWSVLDELAADAGERRPDTTDVAQPLLFAVQVGLVSVLRAHGIRPAGVVGHSAGEMAAAWAAGALGLDDAARVVVARSRAQALTAGDWGMAAVGADAGQVEQWLAPYEGRLEIAGVNSPRDVTVSGESAAVADLGDRLRHEGVFFRDLGLGYAFHSRVMDPLREELLGALAGLKPRQAQLRYASATTGTLLTGAELDAGYWWRNLRQPVLFGAATDQLREAGCAVFVEVGPHPVLSGFLRRAAATGQERPRAVPMMRRDAPGPAGVRAGLSSLLAAGVRADLSVFFPRRGRVVDLPGYPWQRERHWNGNPALWQGGCGDGTIDHPLLGERAAVADPTWHGPFEPGRVPWLADHKVGDAVVMPAAGMIDMALEAGRRVHEGPVEITDLSIHQALVLPFDAGDGRRLEIQTSLSREDGMVQIASRTGRDGSWRHHARGRVRRLYTPLPGILDVEAIASTLPRCRDAGEQYADAERRGLHYGPAFRVMDELRFDDDRVLMRYTGTVDTSGHEAHPTLLDSALQAVFPIWQERAPGLARYLPVAFDRIRAWRRLPSAGHVLVQVSAVSGHEVRLDMTMAAPGGLVCLTVEGCRLRRFDESGRAAGLYATTVMRAAPRQGQAPPPAAPGVPSPGEIARRCADELRRAAAAWNRGDGPGLTAVVRELTAHFTAESVRELLHGTGLGERPFTVGGLVRRGVPSQYTKLLGVLLSNARDHGLAEPVPDGPDGAWRLAGTARPEECFRAAIAQHAGRVVDLALLGRYGRQLTAILRGDRDPAEQVLPEANRHLLEELYADGGMLTFPNRAARAAVRALVRTWPSGRPLRVLEVGAGTGGMTTFLLPELPPDRTRYVFTDVSPAFFPRAQKHFGSYDFVDYRTLDLDRDPVEQGFEEGAYDLLVASNALHTSSDLRAALGHVRRLLADNGLLLAVEAHQMADAALFGLLPSFWNQRDTGLRPDGPYLTLGGWRRLLAEEDFQGVSRLAPPDGPGEGESSALLAQRPPRPTPAAPPVPVPADSEQGWVVVAEPSRNALASVLAERLAPGGSPHIHLVPPTADDDLWATHMAGQTASTTFVVLLGEDRASGVTDGGRLETERALEHTALLRSLARAARRRTENTERAQVRLWLVTPPSGALPAPERPLNPTAACAWGVARSVGNEYPDLTVRRISLDTTDSDTDADRLAAELTAPGPEDEILLTRSGRFVPYVRQETDFSRPLQADATSSYTLRLRDPGRSYQLAWASEPVPTAGPDDLLISVQAAALNYKDVLQALGAMPVDEQQYDAEGQEFALGMECAGTVLAVGSHVRNFTPGDRVTAFGSGMLRSHVAVPATLAARIPDGMKFFSASTLPVVFLTVHRALHDLAKVAPGETVLVHGAAGGVGLAALRYAEHARARIVATAGTPTKRDLLRLLGVQHVLDSRSPGFAERLMEVTGGEGVDVVLNSLSGEAMARGLEVLRPGGRFVELGKQDLYNNGRLPLRPFLNNITFSATDIVGLARTHLPLVASRIAEVAEQVATGAYRPIPHHVYPADRVTDAFEALQHSRHVGKVVISFEEPPVLRDVPRPYVPDPNGTYLITGGLTGFGAATARWLADRGARHLTLVGRRGTSTPEAPALLEYLRQQGASVTAHAADAADPVAMEEVLKAVDAAGPPLRGVLHAAMVIDDAPLAELTSDRVRRVLAPKAEGAAVLDRLTRGHDLDLFVLYSSAAALLGTAQQAGYNGANLFLEALVRSRRQAGLPGLAVAWGALDQVGYVARQGIGDYMRQHGLAPVPPDDALAALEVLPTRGDDVAVVARIDWGTTRHAFATLGAARFDTVRPADKDTGSTGRAALREALATASPEEALIRVTEALTDSLCQVLQTTADRVPADRRLDQLGLDSLMGAELLTTVNQRLGCNLPAVVIFDSATVGDLARRCLRQLQPGR